MQNKAIIDAVLGNGLYLTLKMLMKNYKKGGFKSEFEFIKAIRKLCDTYERLSAESESEAEPNED